MDPVSNDAATLFFTSYIGIAIQILAFVGMVIPGIKFLNKKLEDKINKNVDEKVRPVVATLCKQLEDVKDAMNEFHNDTTKSQEKFQEKTNTAIKYIDIAIMGMRTKKDDDEIEDMKGAC